MDPHHGLRCVMHSWRSRKVRVLTHVVFESVVSGFLGEGELQSSEEEERHSLHCTSLLVLNIFQRFLHSIHFQCSPQCQRSPHARHSRHPRFTARSSPHTTPHFTKWWAMFLNVSALLMLTLAMPAGQKKLEVRQLARQLGGSFPSFHVEKGLSGRHLSVGRQIEVTYDSFKNK